MASRLERLAMIFDDVDAEALIAIPDTTAPDAWWILAETGADGLHRETVELDILQAVLRTIPAVRARVQLLESGRLPRDPDGRLDRPAACRIWRDHRRWVQPQDIEAKPGSPLAPLAATGSAEIDVAEAGEGGESDQGHPPIASLLLRAILLARFADRPALASIGDDDRLVASERLTPGELMALVDEVGRRLGLRAELESLRDIGGATITSLTRQFNVAEAIPDAVDADDEADAEEGVDADAESPPPAWSGPGHGATARPFDRAVRPEDLVAGRIDGPLSDPMLGAAETPTPADPRPNANSPAVSGRAPRSPDVVHGFAASTGSGGSPIPAARPPAGGGRRRATRRLRRAGAVIRPGLVACAPIGVHIAEGGRLELGRNVTIMPGVRLHVGPEAFLLVEDGVRLGPDVRIVVEAGRVELGADVRLDAAAEILARGEVRLGAAVIVGLGGCVTTELRSTARGSTVGPRPGTQSDATAWRSVIVAAGTVIAAGDIVRPADPFRSAA